MSRGGGPGGAGVARSGRPPRAAALAVLALLATLALWAAPAARAQSGGPGHGADGLATRGYLSFGAGASSYDANCGRASACDRVGGAARAALGFFFSSELGVELAVADFGHSRIGDRFGDTEFRLRMVGVGLVVPLEAGSRFHGMLRFGIAGVRTTATPLPADSTQAVASSTTAEGYYGLTLGYLLTPQLAAELSLDGTRGYAGDSGGRVNALTLGLSLRY